MAVQQSLDSPTPPQSNDPSHSQYSCSSSSDSTSSSSSSDPSLTRNLSSSRLNADASEFVPGRTTPLLPQPMMMIQPPPPPPAPLHMYHHHHPTPFRVPIPSPHYSHRFPHYFPFRIHGHHGYQQRGGVNSDPKSGLSEDTIQKIVNQVEYYFCDLNLATTDHLMRFISKDPEGYVPIHIVASFKKIKSFINSYSQLATLLQHSSKLVVSEDGKKVRRIYPITKSALEELHSRIVIAENLPEDYCYQNLMKIFSAVGSVKNIRTCQPQNSGNGHPSATARSAKTGFSNKVHAFVEYELVELAEKAVAELNQEGNWRNSLRVRLMLQHQVHEQGRVVVHHHSNNPMNNTEHPSMGKSPGPRMPDVTGGFSLGRGKPAD